MYDYCKADNKDLINAWNMFVDTGIVPTEYLRPEDDYTSWVRCNHKAIYKKKLSSNTYFCDIPKDTCLINNSYRVMDYMDRILSRILRSHYALLLTDAQGKPLVDIAYQNNEVIPWEKGNCVENHTVLKALDIACNENQVIEVYGYEHLYQRGNNWHTIGHPIFNFDKSVAGGFGVICQTDMIPTIVPIVKIGAQLIQSTLILEQIARNNINILIEGNRNAAIAINEYGTILNANLLFAELTNMPPHQMIGREFTDFVRGDIDNNMLFSIYDGFNQLDRVYLAGQEPGETYEALMAKSIIGNYGSHPLLLLSFNLKKSPAVYNGALLSDHSDLIFENLIGSSPAIMEVKKIAQRAAKSMSNVLIEGESGTGKELIAQSIHRASRPQGPFIAINCGAITKELLQSELFGYEEGAFTGAKKGGQPGKFELANGGTIFLDEVGEMPIDMQVSLLRCLQEKTVTRVGGAVTRKIDVRIIAATNRCLYDEVKKGNFREDLYYRLNVIKIRMPALRERIQDIPALCRHILKNLSQTINIGPIKVSKEAMDCLSRYEWPGNVRELHNCLESALIYMDNNIIRPDCLPQQLAENLPQAYADCAGNLKEYERVAITEAIIRNKGNISRSAKELGIARSTLYLKIEKLNITY